MNLELQKHLGRDAYLVVCEYLPSQLCYTQRETDWVEAQGQTLRTTVRTKSSIEFYHCGYLHRPLELDTPAVIIHNRKGQVVHREWWWRGLLHRPNNLPAVVNTHGQMQYWRFGVRYIPEVTRFWRCVSWVCVFWLVRVSMDFLPTNAGESPPLPTLSLL